MRYIVLAGDYVQAEAWRVSNNLSRFDILFASNPEALRGLTEGMVVRVGTYSTRPDKWAFERELQFLKLPELGSS